jgi:peroxiredoxin
LFQWFQNKQEGTEKTEKKEKTESTSDIILKNMLLLKPLELQSEGWKLSPELKITETTGKEMSIGDIFGNQNAVLIYRFSETHCDICISQHIAMLKDMAYKLDIDQIILLSAYTNTKKLKVASQANDLKFKIYNIWGNLHIPLEQASNPYFFILDKNLVCRSFFAAIKENPQMTSYCLERMFDVLNSARD